MSRMKLMVCELQQNGRLAHPRRAHHYEFEQVIEVVTLCHSAFHDEIYEYNDMELRCHAMVLNAHENVAPPALCNI
jgi:hypothetical protein